ncbi:hypothetical protein G7032_06595 [Pseudomonas monteilii]|uniref:hypothetical protein n=1 Tax=Pseudomonas TaxID=286 RepID=UPI0015E42B57|nr:MULTISPECIES: hypothetical protein [Pseudomonas]MBA1315533.1 hypothetical protein [Pseudomonas monteilii]MDC3841776.1 hypothetical protein [Pseudomonas aeruginosa]HEQ0067638.1 hypothetical protein [Pseudomonas aeruginosa]
MIDRFDQLQIDLDEAFAENPKPFKPTKLYKAHKPLNHYFKNIFGYSSKSLSYAVSLCFLTVLILEILNSADIKSELICFQSVALVLALIYLIMSKILKGLFIWLKWP